jgi:hypothetical protein
MTTLAPELTGLAGILPVGRELDAAIAHLLGWKQIDRDCYVMNGKDTCGAHPSGQGGWDGYGRMQIPCFSERIADAWQAVEYLHAAGWEMSLAATRQVSEPWECRFWFGGERDYQLRAIAHAATAAHAICLAVLKAWVKKAQREKGQTP